MNVNALIELIIKQVNITLNIKFIYLSVIFVFITFIRNNREWAA